MSKIDLVKQLALDNNTEAALLVTDGLSPEEREELLDWIISTLEDSIKDLEARGITPTKQNTQANATKRAAVRTKR